MTLIGWGSSWGVIREAAGRLNDSGVSTNQLHFKYIHPFHEKEAREILERCKKTIVIEGNFTGQFRRHLRAETGITLDHQILKYDGEPFDPAEITRRVQAILEGKPHDYRIQESEALEMAYHFIRIHLEDKARPGRLVEIAENGYGESVWDVEIVDRAELDPRGKLIIGRETGSIHSWEPAVAQG